MYMISFRRPMRVAGGSPRTRTRHRSLPSSSPSIPARLLPPRAHVINRSNVVRPEDADLLEDLWGLVDADGSGSLDFFEVGALFHILSLIGTQCDLCHKTILDDTMWACRPCCTNYIRGHMRHPADWATMCGSCAKTEPRIHKACGGGRMELVPHDPLVNLTESPLFCELSARAGMYGGTACLCCGVVHMHVPDYLGTPGSRGRHMLPAPGSNGYICELCAVWICSRCGGSHCDLEDPQDGQWCKTLYHKECQQKGNGNWCFAKKNLAKTANDSSRAQCPACQVLFRQQAQQPQHSPQPPQRQLDNTSAVCVCCGLAHERVPAYLSAAGSDHMLESPDGSGYICELCVVWICERCGGSHCNLKNPKVGQWRQTLVHADKCKKKGKGGWEFATGALAKTANDHSRRQCTTCRVTFMELQARQQAQPENGHNLEELADAAVAGLKVGAGLAGLGCSVM